MFYNSNTYRPLVTSRQITELRRLGFRGPASYLFRDEASREISRLRRLVAAQQGAARSACRFPLTHWTRTTTNSFGQRSGM